MTFKPSAVGPSRAMLQFVEDEQLRAPLLFDQLAESTSDYIKKKLTGLNPVARSVAVDLLQALKNRRATLCDVFVRSLREQVQADLRPGPPAAPSPAPRQGLRAATLSLVDEDEVALDVELAHVTEQIRSVAEFELRELQTYTAALSGDMDVVRDHNPFRAETYARALWAAAQALPLTRGAQVQFMRYASEPLAALLRQAYAASSSRLDMQGIEPAAYRTVILPSGMRRSRGFDVSYSPDLQQVREVLSVVTPVYGHDPSPTSAPAAAPARPPASRPGAAPAAPPLRALPASLPPRVDAQTEALVARLFEAIRTDDRVPADVLLLIMRLHTPALRLAQVEGVTLADETHPMWRFINLLAYEAEMMPDNGDPERMQLLRTAQATIEVLAAEAAPSRSLYTWACEKLEGYLRQRLERRCARAASQIGALQKLEDRLQAGQPMSPSLSGALDVPQLDTVPANLLPDAPPAPADAAHRWLDDLAPGTWLRLFLQGRWVQAQVLWPGERREAWLLGDGASDATWAIRRGALAALYEAQLLKGLTQRSLVRRAARQVHAQHAA